MFQIKSLGVSQTKIWQQPKWSLYGSHISNWGNFLNMAKNAVSQTFLLVTCEISIR